MSVARWRYWLHAVRHIQKTPLRLSFLAGPLPSRSWPAIVYRQKQGLWAHPDEVFVKITLA